MLAETEVHRDGSIDGKRVNPSLRLSAPTDEGSDLQTLASRQGGAKLAEDAGVEGALGGRGVEVDFDSPDSGKTAGLKQGVGCGTACGFVVLKSASGLDADHGFCPDGWRNKNPLVAGNDRDFIGDKDACGQESDTEALRVGGAEIFRFLPGPEDDGRRLKWESDICWFVRRGRTIALQCSRKEEREGEQASVQRSPSF